MSPLCNSTSVAQSLSCISTIAIASSLYHTHPLKRYRIINSSLYLRCIKHPPTYIHYAWTRRYAYTFSPSTLDIFTDSQTHPYSVIKVSLYLVLQTPRHIFPFLQTPCPADKWKTNLMSLVILFHFLCAQHVSDINISIIRSLRLCCWITTLVVLFSVRCALEIWCGWCWVVLVLQAEPNLQRTTNWEQDDRCGNSTTQPQASDNGYINVRNMLST